MGYLIKTNYNAISVFRLGLLFLPGRLYYVEDSIFDYPEMRSLIKSCFLSIEQVASNPFVGTKFDLSATKHERDVEIIKSELFEKLSNIDYRFWRIIQDVYNKSVKLSFCKI